MGLFQTILEASQRFVLNPILISTSKKIKINKKTVKKKDSSMFLSYAHKVKIIDTDGKSHCDSH